MTTKPPVRSVAFRRERESQWSALDRLVERALSGGLGSLDAEELHQLPILYRQTLASLSVARRTLMDQALIEYLEALSARAYLAMYGSRRKMRGALRHALWVELPRRMRRLAPELGLSTAILGLGVVVSIALMLVDPGWYDAFVDPALAGGRDPNASTETLRSALYSGGPGEVLTTFASFLFVHNARIGLMAYALGFAAGVPTALLLFSNGLMLGAFIQLYAERGLLFELGGWLLPHGIPEIGAVIICGAAGLRLGRAMTLPGRDSVRTALAHAGRETSLIVMGAVLLFAIAGVVEGVFRQVIQDDVIRYGVALFNATWFVLWLFVGGRDPQSKKVKPKRGKKGPAS